MKNHPIPHSSGERAYPADIPILDQVTVTTGPIAGNTEGRGLGRSGRGDHGGQTRDPIVMR
ncbi:hypothetical protein V0288_11790 [Pannus brasiliensis CCIBt3594]|uniref:Uncharacterized protein n=1 Tax=Pannus brasiliensis CCIBt3594 TaxID=1427578 RepID=A0AAW9QSH4_9CHRO